MTRIEQEDNGKKGRYCIYVEDLYAGEMTYTWAGDTKFIIDHTDIEEMFTGKGLGKLLVLRAVDFARTKGLKIIPLCPFAKKVFDTDGSLNDIIF